MEHLGTGNWPSGAVVGGWPREELVLNWRVALRKGGVGLVSGCEMWLDRGCKTRRWLVRPGGVDGLDQGGSRLDGGGARVGSLEIRWFV